MFVGDQMVDLSDVPLEWQVDDYVWTRSDYSNGCLKKGVWCSGSIEDSRPLDTLREPMSYVLELKAGLLALRTFTKYI